MLFADEKKVRGACAKCLADPGDVHATDDLLTGCRSIGRSFLRLYNIVPPTMEHMVYHSYQGTGMISFHKSIAEFCNKGKSLDGMIARERRRDVRKVRFAVVYDGYARALEQLRRLADELERTHPGAASSLREGMEETLTVIRLGIKDKLRRTLESTNACESMIDTVRTTQRNVKHWSSGEMGLRWTAAGMLEAEKQFRKVIGYTQLPQLAVAIERRLHLQQPNPPTTQEKPIAVTV